MFTESVGPDQRFRVLGSAGCYGARVHGLYERSGANDKPSGVPGCSPDGRRRPSPCGASPPSSLTAKTAALTQEGTRPSLSGTVAGATASPPGRHRLPAQPRSCMRGAGFRASHSLPPWATTSSHPRQPAPWTVPERPCRAAVSIALRHRLASCTSGAEQPPPPTKEGVLSTNRPFRLRAKS